MFVSSKNPGFTDFSSLNLDTQTDSKKTDLGEKKQQWKPWLAVVPELCYLALVCIINFK